MKLLLLAALSVASVLADNEHCVAECGKISDMMKASGDADNLLWQPSCKACFRAKCETEEFKNDEKKAARCAAHKGCRAKWDACAEAKDFSSEGCCDYGKCVCDANPKSRICAPTKAHCQA